MKKRKLKMRKIIILIIIVICLVLMVFSIYNIILWLKFNKENSDIKEQIAETVSVKQENNKQKYSVDFKSLKEKNPDTIAYLNINSLNIDYIVVKGDDNSYYLNHNFSKEYNISGWIFGDYRNKFDGTDKNIIIFGHNIKDGSMFGPLKNVLDQSWQENKENLEIILVTEKGQYKYQVFSTYSINPECYYITTEFNNNDEYAKFLKEIKSRSNFNYSTEVSGNDKILTLSSCFGDSSKRVVIHAKLIENE